jgi:hypothetical protein
MNWRIHIQSISRKLPLSLSTDEACPSPIIQHTGTTCAGSTPVSVAVVVRAEESNNYFIFNL